MKNALSPLWTGLTSVLAYFYGIWAATHAYTTDAGLQSGYGLMVSWIYLPVVFLITMVVTAVVIKMVLNRVEKADLRISLILIALMIYLAGSGLPSLIVLIIAIAVFAVTYRKSQKVLTDSNDLKKFMDQ